MNQLDRRIALLACKLEFTLHSQTRFFYLWHVLFQIDDLD